MLYRVPQLAAWFSLLLAVVLLFVPQLVLRSRPLEWFGFTARPLGRNLVLFAATVAIVFPLFAAGFVVWHRVGCEVAALRPLVAGVCSPSAPWGRLGLRVPWDATAVAAQLVAVAAPEEFFFRGYVQGRLAEAWETRRVFGVAAGPVVIASALFATCHLVVQGAPSTLAVFFPGLVFGWMRARTGSLLPGILFHAACNLYIELLQHSLFG